MKPEIVSLVAAAVSAIAAMITVYMYRSHGKGFVWTKEPRVVVAYLPDRSLYVEVILPLVNLGTGNIRFLSLRAKRVHLKNNAIETFYMDMDEAYFPPGVQVTLFRTPVTVPPGTVAPNTPGEFRVINTKDYSQIPPQDMQADVNRHLEDIGEVLVIVECKYKDGSWFGLAKRTTVIAMAMNKVDLNYLSKARRQDLDNLFR